MTRDDIQSELTLFFKEEFEINKIILDEDLREAHGFDSIDAIELLRQIEIMLNTELTRDEKEMALEIRTFNQVIDYVESLAIVRDK